MKHSEAEVIKKLKKKLKKCKKKNKQYLEELIICQEKRSGHWDKLVYEKARNEKLTKILSSYPYVTLRYMLLPFTFLKSKANKKLRKSSTTKLITSTPPPPIIKKQIRDIKVALICDEFSYNSFKYEFDTIDIEPQNWEDKFETEKPDIFFCESAWSGIDSKRRPWKGKIYSSTNFPKENRTELLEILKYCNNHHIPTVFWNKEDPTHYHDKIHDFIKTAINFDYIFTTDEDCIAKYKSEYGHSHVFCLPFATQPRLFNPIERFSRSDKIVFAGGWYENHKERCLDMKDIFNNILASDKEIEIFDRYYGDTDQNHIFPKKYQSFTKPAVGHHEADKIYKSSVFGLNINTVKKSETMFARRVYELISSNTFVISNYSKGVKNLLGNNVIFAEQEPERLSQLTDQEIDQIRDENLHSALENHTYEKRVQFILDTMSYPYIPPDNSVTVICIANSETDISSILSFYRLQQLDDKKLLIILSVEIPDIEVSALFNKYNKSDIGVVAYSYLELKAQNWSDIIETQYIAVMDYSSEILNNSIKKALLHTTYIDDCIKINSKVKYTYSNKTQITNILSQKKYLELLLKNYDKALTGSFYNV